MSFYIERCRDGEIRYWNGRSFSQAEAKGYATERRALSAARHLTAKALAFSNELSVRNSVAEGRAQDVVMVNLTQAQAKGLRFASGEIMEDEDGIASLFIDCDAAAAQSAYAKIRPGAFELTKAEARALSFAAGNVMDALDVMQEMFPTGPQRRAAINAYDKLKKAAYGR